MNKSINEKNFKDETIEMIGTLQVDEYYLKYYGTAFDEEGTQVYSGTDDINWDEIPEEYLEYDDGYGIQYWDGWITFKNSPDWIERVEYDGSERWMDRMKPSLQNEKEYEDD